MRTAQVLLMLAFVPWAWAQTVTCTPDVSSETCKEASSLFEKEAINGGAQIVISDPNSVRMEGESILRRIERRAEALGESWNPVLPNSFSSGIIFFRGDEPCPRRVIISTDLFRAVNIKTDENGTFIGTEPRDGFDRFQALGVAMYVSGFVEGCFKGLIPPVSARKPVK